ncbi:MAG: zinc-ribbon domain-containing protein [Oscillospiraceae bacterium]|nr:zinc-ribbon domain-containing protein [Oscillospiraceae bacterium]
MKFCKHCGNELGDISAFCPFCGKRIDAEVSSPAAYEPGSDSTFNDQSFRKQQPSAQIQAAAYPEQYYRAEPYWSVPKPHYAPGSFVENAHRFGSSALFLVGIILFTVGAVINAFMNISTGNIFSILGMGVIALPITGGWMIYAASKNPQIPERTLSALKVFKAYIVIIFIAAIAISIFIGYQSTVMFKAANEYRNYTYVSGYGSGYVFGDQISTLETIGGTLIVAAIATFIIGAIYFTAQRNVISDLTYRIEHNSFGVIEGVTKLSVLTYISVGVSALGLAIAGAATANARASYGSYGWLLDDFDIAMFQTFSGGAIFFSLMASAGTVLLVVVLNQFNNSLKMRMYNQRQYGSKASICERCGKEYSTSSCPHCGFRPENDSTWTCPDCGKRISKNTSFCTDCGSYTRR